MLITIAGLPGAGKTSVAKELAARLGINRVSVGDIRGQMAMEKGITIDELNALGTASDKLADQKQMEIAATWKDGIVEGRISWHLIPASFKILVTVDPDEGARRIYEDKKSGAAGRDDERHYLSIADAKESIAARVLSDRRRLNELYGVEDFIDPKHFDFVLDTTLSPGPKENADKIIAEMRRRQIIK
jgi:predicted cytidylate kinase